MILTVIAVSSLWYVCQTWCVFASATSEQLSEWMRASHPRDTVARWGAVLSGTGPVIAVQWSFLALAAILIFTVWPHLLTDPITVVLCVIVVGTTWSVTLMSYAVHYARFDELVGGFEFPDRRPRLFMDYLYLAMQVQSTFGTSDVSLTDTTARSIVTGHAVVSFAFNTIIIAVLLTVLFLGN